MSYDFFGEFLNALNEKDTEYTMSLDDLACLCRDFQADCFDGFVSNDRAYIIRWIEENCDC